MSESKRIWTRNEGLATVGTEKPLMNGTVSGSIGCLRVHWNEETGEQVPVLDEPRVPGMDLVGWTKDFRGREFPEGQP
jgi:hypothetical protein